MKKTEEQIEAHRRLCEHFDDTLLGDVVERVAQPTCVPCLRGKTPVVMARCTRVRTNVRI